MTETTTDTEFLNWVAGWLDKIDPILIAVYNNYKSVSSLYTEEELNRLNNWLEGQEVQERLRKIAKELE